MIQLRNVKMVYPIPKRYRDYLLHPFKKEKGITAIYDVNLDIKKGDSVGFLGPNGAGKTTLLKLIGGLLYPTAGKITANGFDTVNHNLEARKSIGFVINEERSFYWRLTGIQNLEFFGILDNLSGVILRKRISELLHFVGLKDKGNKPVSGYSSGMIQRLAIARGLIANPDILIMDEPTKALDPLSTEKLRQLIYEEIHKKGGKTLLIATHQINEAEVLCNKICLISRGQVMAYKEIDKINLEYDNLTKFYKAIMATGDEG